MRLELQAKRWKEAVSAKLARGMKMPKLPGGLKIPPPKMPLRLRKLKKKTIFLVSGAVFLCAISAAFWLLLFSEDEKVALTETLTSGSLATTITGTGVTVPADSQTITVASTAEIQKVYVSAGDTVEAGDLLYEQDDSELDDQIEEYQDNISDLNDQLADYQQQLSELTDTISALTVSAPFSGHISEISADAGDSVSSGTKLAVLVDDSKLTLTQYFSYTYENEVYIGMKAGVSVASLMMNLDGKVTDIQKVERLTTEGTRCFAVTATVENPGALTEGMTSGGYLLSDSGEKLYPAIEGVLEYKNTKTLTAKASGELSSVNAKNYQKVTAGQTLFVIDGEDYQSQLSSLSDRISQAQERIVSYEDKIKETEESRSDYTVKAEISGKVIQVGVRAGESPRSASQTAIVVYNLDNMEITANIDELDIDSIEKGMDVTITRTGSQSTEDTNLTGTISEVSYEATNTDGVAYFPITIEIPADGSLSAGVNVSYTIKVGDESEGLLAPISALKNTSSGTCLFVQSGTRPDSAIELEGVEIPDGFYAVPVEVGVSNSRYVRILSGANEGDVVFTRYQETAPSGNMSDTQSESGEEEEETQQNQQFQGPPSGDFQGGPGGAMGG